MQNDKYPEAFGRLGLFALDEGMAREGDLETRVHPEDKKAFLSLCPAAYAGEERSAEYRIKDPSGEWRWMRTRIVDVKEDGGPLLRIGIDEDVTERKLAEQELRSELEETGRRLELTEAMRIAELVASASPDLVSTVAAVLNQAKLNIPFVAASVYSRQGMSLELVDCVPEREGDQEPMPAGVSRRLWEVIDSRSPLFLDEASAPPRVAGDSRCSWLAVPLIFRGQALGALEFWMPADEAHRRDLVWPAMVFGDMLAVELDAERRRRDLVKEANTDQLTGLHTRRNFFRIASKLLPRLAQRDQSAALFLADIDRFKSFNDRFGHLRGDEILRTVAQILKEGLRQEDIICRFGGEEIVALLPGATESIALEIAERLRSQLERHSFAGIGESVTASFGVAACKASECKGLERLVERADRAMYQAKERGRNRIVLDEESDEGFSRP